MGVHIYAHCAELGTTRGFCRARSPGMVARGIECERISFDQAINTERDHFGEHRRLPTDRLSLISNVRIISADNARNAQQRVFAASLHV